MLALADRWTCCSVLLIFLLSGACVCSGQVAPQPVRRPAPLIETTSNHRPLPPLQRFLGWKYAAVAHQDTSHWIRPVTDSRSTRPEAQEKHADTEILPSATSAGSSAVATFAAAAKLPTGFLPTAVAQGDFNGDGKLDLAISNGGDDTIYVYPGNGDGTFGVPGILYTTGQAPVWLAAAQLRTTGHVDLITVDADSNAVEVFFGNGDGTFQQGITIATLAETPTFVLPGDFNGDGHVDLAIGLIVPGGTAGPQFEVLLGDGNGAFPNNIVPPLIRATSATPTTWLATADLNNDSHLDLVATVAGAGAIAYLNQGGTSFSQGSVFNPVDGTVAVALGDMDGDDCPDAVETGAGGFVTIAKGKCDGTFTQGPPTAETGDLDFAVSVADVNGDGKLDVVGSSAFTDSEIQIGVGAFGGYLVSVLLGDGAGHLSGPAIYRVGPDAYSLAVADLHGNGKPDIVTISQTESNALHLVNDGAGGFGSPAGEAIGYVNPTPVYNAPVPGVPPVTVDLNGDGKPDVLLMETASTTSYPIQIAALLNDGTGKFSSPVRTPLTVLANDAYLTFTAGKFRGTAAADLVYSSYLAGSQNVVFMPGNGDGTFGSATIVAALQNPCQIVSGDFNSDGKLDFAVLGGSCLSPTGTQELDVFLGNGDGTFRQLPSQTFTALSKLTPEQLLSGDFNHDGKLDLLIGYDGNGGWVSSGDDLDLLVGNGDGTFQNPVILMSHFGPVAVADLNHDGYLDLIQARDPNANITEDALAAAESIGLAPAVAIYLGQPGGNFPQPTVYWAPGSELPSYSPALVGDFNGDGKLDVALPYVPATIGRPWERRLQIFQGNGDGTLTTNTITYQLPAYDQPVVGTDYRGVGLTDLLDLVGASSSINTISAAPGPALAVTADAPLTGPTGAATVTLALPSSSTQTVQLSSSDPAVTVPGSLTFAPGQTQQSFTFSVGSGLDTTHLLVITAGLGAQTATAYFAKPNPAMHPDVIALVGNSTQGTSSVATGPGGSLPLLLSLQSVEGYSGVFSQFSCSGLPAGAQCNFVQPSLALLPGGYAQVAFEITTSASTPAGTFPITIGASDGVISPSVNLTLGIGGFSISSSQTLIQVNGTSGPSTTVSAIFANGYSQSVQLTCSGLPSGAVCSIPSVLYPGAPSTTVAVSTTSDVAVQDYLFTITGTAGNMTSSVPLSLRVSDFSAALQTTAATITSGGSATFNVKLASLNHFANTSLLLSCQSAGKVTCSTPNQYTSLGDGSTITVPVTVSATLASAMIEPSGFIRVPWVPALACCVVCVFLPRKRDRRLMGSWSVFLGLVLFSLLGCGGGSNSGGTGNGNGNGGSGTGGSNSGPQTIIITVSAQAMTGSGMLQHSAGTITLTVNP